MRNFLAMAFLGFTLVACEGGSKGVQPEGDPREPDVSPTPLVVPSRFGALKDMRVELGQRKLGPTEELSAENKADCRSLLATLKDAKRLELSLESFELLRRPN